MIPLVLKVDRISGTKNATHNILGIWIERDLEHFDAILAQERFEWWYNRKWGALFMAPLLIAAPLVSWWLLFAAFLVHLLGPRLPYLHRRMELIGHMIETLWAVKHDGADFETYLAKEARALTRYDQFKGWSADKITQEMRKVERIAAKHI